MDQIVEMVQSNPVVYGGALAFIALVIVAKVLKSALVFIVGAALIGGAVFFGSQGGPAEVQEAREGATDSLHDRLEGVRDRLDNSEDRLKDVLGE